MLLATALALLITGCAQQTFTVQNKPAAVAPRKPSPIISSFLELGRETVMQWNLWRRRNVVKTETQQTFVNGLLGFFIYFDIYVSAGSAVCMLTIIAWVARYGRSLFAINILLGSFQLFCLSDQPLWGWNNPVQRCLPVGELHYPRRRQ